MLRVRAKFYGPNKVWTIQVPGYKELLYFYPNGTVKLGINGPEIQCTNETQEITNDDRHNYRI